MSKLLSHGKKRPPSAEKLNLDAFCADGIAKASRVVDANASVSIFDDVFNKFKDLEYLVELVQTEQAALASPEKDIRFEGWRVIYEKGVKKGYDWSSQTCDNLEQLWEACVKQTKELSLAPRTGMKHGTYNDIYQFLTNGKYPEEIGYNYQKKKDLRTKCSEFAINSSDQIEYCGRGIRKLVLLEGEVEPFIRYVHLALGHAKYDVVGNVISYHFHTSCSIRQMARTLIGGCTTECHRLATSKDSKGIKIKFQRSPRLHIEISLNNEILPLSDLECLAESSENAVRVGMPISKYRRIFDALANVYDKDHQRLAKDYKLDQQYGLLTAEGKIVLDATVGAEVIFQLHNLYGHATRMGLEDLVSIHFSCYGLTTFSKGIRSLCSLCVLRSGSPVDATPSEIYGDADYEVLIDWKDGKRNFSIVPLGLDQALVDSYVHGIIKKHNVTEEEIRAKQVKQKLNPELMTIHQKILGISSPMLNIVNRTSNYTAVPTIFCQKRRRQIDGFTPEGYSMDFCGTSASKVVLPPKATAEEVKVVSDYEELLPLNCFSRYEHNMASNIGWTRDHKRSHADFDVPQNRQYDEHVYTTATSVSCESSRSDEMFYMENHSTKDNLKIYPIANAPEGSFIELQPVKGCSQYDTSMTATYVIEDHYHLSDPHQYTLMLNDFAYCSTDYSRL